MLSNHSAKAVNAYLQARMLHNILFHDGIMAMILHDHNAKKCNYGITT
jgi:hypothetical protein